MGSFLGSVQTWGPWAVANPSVCWEGAVRWQGRGRSYKCRVSLPQGRAQQTVLMVGIWEVGPSLRALGGGFSSPKVGRAERSGQVQS